MTITSSKEVGRSQTHIFSIAIHWLIASSARLSDYHLDWVWQGTTYKIETNMTNNKNKAVPYCCLLHQSDVVLLDHQFDWIPVLVLPVSANKSVFKQNRYRKYENHFVARQCTSQMQCSQLFDLIRSQLQCGQFLFGKGREFSERQKRSRTVVQRLEDQKSSYKFFLYWLFLHSTAS